MELLGLTLAEGLTLGDVELDGLTLPLGETLGETEAEGLWLLLGLTLSDADEEGDTEALGLTLAEGEPDCSMIARCAIQEASASAVSPIVTRTIWEAKARETETLLPGQLVLLTRLPAASAKELPSVTMG